MKLLNLDTKYIGRNLIYYESIDSTQSEAWRQVKKKVENGTVIFANMQTNGMGTHGRRWYTDEKDNIALSIVLYPNCKIEKLNNITIDIANAIVEVFKEFYLINLDIKYPNDIVYGGKKLGGILTETRLCGEMVKDLVIGIGLNLNQVEFKNEIKEIATSIKKEFGITVDRFKIVSEICNVLEKKFCVIMEEK